MHMILRSTMFRGNQSRLKQLLATNVSSKRFLSTQDPGKRVITLALYRQMLRWCDETDDDIPLSNFIPPVYMTPPQLDEISLREMATNPESPLATVFPSKIEVDEKHLTCLVHNAADVKSFLRGAFRLNAASTTADDQKMRISLAFDGLKSLNELKLALADLESKRVKHRDREGVSFRVGQVVRHKEEEYRAVIVGWTKNESSADKPQDATSLTSKSYELDNDDSVMYTVVLDVGDAHLHHNKLRNVQSLGIAEVLQSDLEMVQDESLRRIRNQQIGSYFSRYDSDENLFVPNEIVAYEYPNDVEIQGVHQPVFTKEVVEAALAIATGAQEVADHMAETILGVTSAPEARGFQILSFFLERMRELSRGDVVLPKDRLSAGEESAPKLASMHLQQLLNFHIEVNDLLRQRKASTQTDRPINFALGDVVIHKFFGFRGVVVGWDPKPSVDVSRWDGLQHIKDPHTYPFYHVVPDHNDCVEAFGSERPSRYVCEANLEVCPVDRRDLSVDMDPHWTFHHSDKVYIPPEDLKFKHGQDLEDEGLTEQCLEEMKGFLTRLLVASRDGVSSGDLVLDDLARSLSSQNLHMLLKAADSRETASVLSDAMKIMWKAHLDSDLRDKLDRANNLLYSGNTEEALNLFSELVDEDPSYAEAWNRASTCEFMLGNLEASLAAAKRTVEILPNHFQALNGMGLVYTDMKELPSAVENFRKGLDIDPWSPVSSRLASSIETLKLSEKLSRTTNEE